MGSIDENKTQPSKYYKDSYSKQLSELYRSSHFKKSGERPAEVGTLAPVFEKSATEIKLKEK